MASFVGSFLGRRSVFGVKFGRRFNVSFLVVSRTVFGAIAPNPAHPPDPPDPADLPGLQALAPAPGQGNRQPAFRMMLVRKDKILRKITKQFETCYQMKTKTH